MVAGWGAAGEQCPVPGQGGSEPPSPSPQLRPPWPWSPVGQRGRALLFALRHRSPWAGACPGRCGSVARQGGTLGWEGAESHSGSGSGTGLADEPPHPL